VGDHNHPTRLFLRVIVTTFINIIYVFHNQYK
jgi:hypothetical protein